MAKQVEGNGFGLPLEDADALREEYARAKAAFTEEDLRRFTEEEEGIPLAQVIKELEEIERQGKLKRT